MTASGCIIVPTGADAIYLRWRQSWGAFHGQFLVDGNRHKKARRACAVRAFRTSYQALVTINQEFWCWRPCNWWGRWLSLLEILIFCAKGKAQKEWRWC
ncbi:hypothetical protein HMPREF0880_00871 [Yokenella regensburgei ATCC 43003]|nr:hypothetical protein HMPREF0880_00871 [Yokenella regensburgei ATCC 43003]